MPALPAPARAITAATTDAVAAIRGTDAPAYDEAVGRLVAVEPELVRLVLGAVVRMLLEDLHPDGVSSDDLLALIRSCARTSIGWYPEVDVEALVVVLTGALGVHEPDEEPRRFTPLEVARHAPLFIGELLTAGPTRSLATCFATAYQERAQAELNEMP